MKFAILFLILANPNRLSHLPSFEGWIVWNVGQGQWVTHVQGETCTHFDMGGEVSPLKRVLRMCVFRRNKIYLSHDDQDHTRFVSSFLNHDSEACLGQKIYFREHTKSGRSLRAIKLCPDTAPGIHQLFKPLQQNKQNNRNSLVFWSDQVLLPGDSTRTEEKTWALNLKIPQTRIWLLGHHGSASSTSKLLLERLPNSALAVASSRRAKYNHPHPRVIQSLRQKKMPLILTEEWGHLMFERKRKN
jgi:competence protein ComEC